MHLKDGKIYFSKRDKTAGEKNLKKARRLFRGGKNWITGDEKDMRENGEFSYCLIGAIKEADGKGELAAATALCLALREPDESEAAIFALDYGDKLDNIVQYNDNLDDDPLFRHYRHISSKIDSALRILRRR